MNRNVRRFLTLAILLLVLAACGGAVAEEEPAAPVAEEPAAVVDAATDTPAPTAAPTDTPAAEEDDAVDAAEAAADDTATADDDAANDNAAADGDTANNMPDGVSTIDDRSDRLRSLTRDWNTNWELHSIDYDEILSGGPPRDGIPSIDNPQFISQAEAAEWLVDVEPVVALEINGDARAYPLQILTWHEIVNDTVGDVPVIVTFCPLCNSALVFERIVDGEPVEFGVSGLLRFSDLIMYDRKTESLWQQFTGEAVVGDKTGEILPFVASSLVSFADFKAAYPDGVVLSRDTGFSRNYGRNPYVGYDTIGSNPFLFDGELDARLPAVARVATVPLDGIDVAYPYTLLEEVRVINDAPGGTELVVFFQPGTTSALGAAEIATAEDVGATGVFSPFVDERRLTFSFDGVNIVDDQTGSVWNILGQATAGELAGARLDAIDGAADHFWFSWAAFRPDTIVYTP